MRTLSVGKPKRDKTAAAVRGSLLLQLHAVLGVQCQLIGIKQKVPFSDKIRSSIDDDRFSLQVPDDRCRIFHLRHGTPPCRAGLKVYRKRYALTVSWSDSFISSNSARASESDEDAKAPRASASSSKSASF